MTRKEALQELLVKVKVGECRNDGTMYEAFGDKWLLCFDAYSGSMDAALSLFEAVLPGWVKWDMSHSYFGYECAITNGNDDASSCDKTSSSRALLIAILDALVEMEDN